MKTKPKYYKDEENNFFKILGGRLWILTGDKWKCRWADGGLNWITYTKKHFVEVTLKQIQKYLGKGMKVKP